MRLLLLFKPVKWYNFFDTALFFWIEVKLKRVVSRLTLLNGVFLCFQKRTFSFFTLDTSVKNPWNERGFTLSEDFKKYQNQVIKNAQILANTLKEEGIKLITDGTDNHLLLLDVKSSLNISGQEAETVLSKINITVNKNSIPFDKEKPKVTSGIRIGTAAMTTLGFKEEQFKQVAQIISLSLKNKEDKKIQTKLKKDVKKLMEGVKWLY